MLDRPAELDWADLLAIDIMADVARYRHTTARSLIAARLREISFAGEIRGIEQGITTIAEADRRRARYEPDPKQQAECQLDHDDEREGLAS